MQYTRDHILELFRDFKPFGNLHEHAQIYHRGVLDPELAHPEKISALQEVNSTRVRQHHGEALGPEGDTNQVRRFQHEGTRREGDRAPRLGAPFIGRVGETRNLEEGKGRKDPPQHDLLPPWRRRGADELLPESGQCHDVEHRHQLGRPNPLRIEPLPDRPKRRDGPQPTDWRDPATQPRFPNFSLGSDGTGSDCKIKSAAPGSGMTPLDSGNLTHLIDDVLDGDDRPRRGSFSKRGKCGHRELDTLGLADRPKVGTHTDEEWRALRLPRDSVAVKEDVNRATRPTVMPETAKPQVTDSAYQSEPSQPSRLESLDSSRILSSSQKEDSTQRVSLVRQLSIGERQVPLGNSDGLSFWDDEPILCSKAAVLPPHSLDEVPLLTAARLADDGPIVSPPTPISATFNESRVDQLPAALGIAPNAPVSFDRSPEQTPPIESMSPQPKKTSDALLLSMQDDIGVKPPSSPHSDVGGVKIGIDTGDGNLLLDPHVSEVRHSGHYPERGVSTSSPVSHCSVPSNVGAIGQRPPSKRAESQNLILSIDEELPQVGVGLRGVKVGSSPKGTSTAWGDDQQFIGALEHPGIHLIGGEGLPQESVHSASFPVREGGMFQQNSDHQIGQPPCGRIEQLRSVNPEPRGPQSAQSGSPQFQSQPNEVLPSTADVARAQVALRQAIRGWQPDLSNINKTSLLLGLMQQSQQGCGGPLDATFKGLSQQNGDNLMAVGAAQQQQRGVVSTAQHQLGGGGGGEYSNWHSAGAGRSPRDVLPEPGSQQGLMMATRVPHGGHPVQRPPPQQEYVNQLPHLPSYAGTRQSPTQAMNGVPPSEPYVNGEGKVVRAPSLNQKVWCYIDLKGIERGTFDSQKNGRVVVWWLLHS
eukprot:GHVN01034199.1.p1 GENE.GHVN01034199.1~~GHVN01034199.1.p1  ORF type:complete len:869 (+),score=96.55 GHVN01034199.1:60-2666(+)